jgi:hypothetical protein
MSLKTWMLGMFAAGATARWYYQRSRKSQSQSQPQGAANHAGRHTYSPDLHAEQPQPRPQQPVLAQPHWQQAGTGSESPNAAERLEAGNRANSPLGQGTPAARVGDDDHVFDSSSQHGPGPINTGLTDFSRGA